MFSKSWVPNGLTSMNLVFGMSSILSTFNGELSTAAACILLALVADGLDGRSARALKVSSEIGKEMDSLCDLVSFGALLPFSPTACSSMSLVPLAGWQLSFLLSAAWAGWPAST